MGIVTIGIDEYISLVKAATKLDCLKRYVETDDASLVVSTDVIKALLGGKTSGGSEGTCISE